MNKSSDYRPDIDGLRAVAVLAVMFHHFAPDLLTGGYVGVDVFFVISGFLITKILRSEISTRSFTFAGFYERRARRIFPVLIFVLVATVTVAHFLFLPSDLTATLRGAVGTALFASNITFWRDMAAGYFVATDTGLNPLLHTWSLGVEEQFYIFFPIVLLVIHRWMSQRTRIVVGTAALVSLVSAAALVHQKSVAVFFLTPFRAWELLAGSLLVYDAVPNVGSKSWRNLLSFLGLAAIIYACFRYTPSTTFPGISALLPVAGAVAVIHAGSGGGSVVSRILGFRPFVFVGLISYSLYLWHWPLVVLTGYPTGMSNRGDHLLALLVASFALATLSYRYIEVPFRRSGGFSRKEIFSISVVALALILGVGITGLFHKGYEGRFSSDVLRFDDARAPKIPFVACEALAPENACVLGVQTDSPSTLAWGDSHMLAWAPALDKVLKDAGRGGLLQFVTSCPPYASSYTVQVRAKCAVHNSRVLGYLRDHPNVHTVLLAAFWSSYFDGPALRDTVLELKTMGKKVVLLGPVPTYKGSVPLMGALAETIGQKFPTTTNIEQRTRNHDFYEIAMQLEHVHVADPIQWFCRPICITVANGEVLYRDSNHLSPAGALAMRDQIRRAVMGVSEPWSMEQGASPSQ